MVQVDENPAYETVPMQRLRNNDLMQKKIDHSSVTASHQYENVAGLQHKQDNCRSNAEDDYEKVD